MRARGGLARGSVGGVVLWFVAVSASAPMTVVAGSVVATFGGSGVVGVPVSFVVLTVVLWLLSQGYVAMARYVPHAASLYAVLTHGLGRPVGVAGGAVAVLGYNAIQISLYGLLGARLAAVFDGPWWAWALAVWVLVGLLGVLRVGIGTRVVTALLIAEIAVIVVFDLVALRHPADGVLSTTAWAPTRIPLSALGGVLALGIAAFVGYECAPAYGEEARGERVAGWASLAALVFLGPLYALSSWAYTVVRGADHVVADAQQHQDLLFVVLREHLGAFGTLLAGTGEVLLVTSIFAAMLSFHTTVARYLFALGREHILPAGFARTGRGVGPRRDAPVTASVWQSATALGVVLAFAVLGADPVTRMFTWLAAIGAVAVLVLLVVAAAAAVRWFHRGGGRNEGRWTRLLAPVLGVVTGTAVLVCTVVYLGALLNTPLLSPQTVIIPSLVGVAALAGLTRAGWLRRHDLRVYERIGRGRPHPLAVPDQRLSQVGR
jgi:amino acid transporter